MFIPQMAVVLKRLAKMIAEANVCLDASSKSLRGYTTKPHPLFLERLRQHYPDLGLQRSIQGRTFSYEKDSAGLTGSQMLNSALQSFYLQEVNPDQEAWVLYPKTSKKTLTGPESDFDTMRSDIEAWVDSHCSLQTDVTSFRDLVAEELGERTVRDLFDNFENSKLANSILQHLMMYNWSFPADKPVVVEGRSSPIGGLTMKSKYYVNRDDNRAYCQDRNRLRLLCGACLHRLIYLKDSRLRRELNVSSVLRVEGKDRLNLVVPRATEGQTTLLILGDISNFTGSLANSWLLLFVIALDLAKNLKFRFSLFSIGGCLMMAPWYEVVITYLYLTVGADCFVEDMGRFEYLSGGFLGVTANITVGLLCLSIIMLDVTRRILKRVFHTQCQAGGDDFAFLLVVADRDKNQICSYIKNDMENHVGLLKEFQVFDVDTLDEGVIDGATFCRKRVILKRTSRHTVLSYEPSCPLPETILPGHKIRRLDLQIRAWRELDLDLARYEAESQGEEGIADTLREVFLRKYPRVRPTRTHTVRHWPPYGLMGVLHNGKILSKRAKEAIDSLPRIDVGPYFTFATAESRLRHLQVTEVIQGVDNCWYKGALSTVYVLKAEVSKIQIECVEEHIVVKPNEEMLSKILDIIRH